MKALYGHHRLLLGAEVAPPPPPSNFDVNMVIILAALLCALICALGLNSIVRCALRCTRRLSTSNASQELVVVAAPRVVSGTRRGLRRSALRQIPVVVYGDGGGDVEVMATECTICLGEFVDGEKVRVLPKCSHGFHVRCIDTWLALHSSCPTCRRPISESGGGVVAVGTVAAAVVVGAGVDHGDAVVGVGDADVG